MADSAIAEKNPRRPYADVKWFLLLAVVVVSAAWILGGRSAPAAPASAPSEGTVRSVLHLEPFVLNLADPDQRAYLRVGIDLGLEKERKDDDPPTALVRDTIVEVLTRCTPNEVLSAEGKNKLKHELLTALQQRAPELGVEEVYFTEFLVQR